MTIAFVKTAKSGTSTDGGASTVPAVFGSNNTAGNAIFVAIQHQGSSVSSVTDNAAGGSNTYSSLGTITVGSNTLELWYALNLKSTATLTVTANFAASPTFRRIIACEYSGVLTAAANDGVDSKSNVGPGTGTDGVTSNSGSAPTTAGSNDVLFCATMGVGGTGTETRTAGTNFTKRDETVDAYKVAVEDRILSATASVIGTWTISANNDQMCICGAFKAAAGSSRGLYQEANCDGIGAGGSFFVNPLGA